MKCNRNFHFICAAGICAASLLLPAAAAAHNYNYVDGGFLARDAGPDDDAGIHLSGSADIERPVALFGEYTDTGEFSHLSAGAMFHAPLTHVLDFTVGGSLESVDQGRRDDVGFGLRGGLRWQVLPSRLELNPEMRHLRVFDDTRTSLRGNALYRVVPRLDLQGAVQAGDDDLVELGLRYNFGPDRARRVSSSEERGTAQDKTALREDSDPASRSR